jgi:cytochrome c oxidase subunit 2
MVAVLAAGCGSHGSSVPDGARTVAVRGEAFRYSPEEVTVRRGESVAIELGAVDVEHDYVSDELDLHVHAGAGETQRGGLTAATAGTYTVYCSISGHRDAGMEGRIVVTP